MVKSGVTYEENCRGVKCYLGGDSFYDSPGRTGMRRSELLSHQINEEKYRYSQINASR